MFESEFRHLRWLLHSSCDRTILSNYETFRANKTGTLSVLFELTMNDYLAITNNLTALQHTVCSELQDSTRAECDGAVFKATLNFDLRLFAKLQSGVA